MSLFGLSLPDGRGDGDDVLRSLHQDDRAVFLSLLNRMRDEDAVDLDLRILTPDGRDKRIVGRMVAAARAADGDPIRLVAFCGEAPGRDDDASRRELIYRSLVEAHSEMMCRFRLDGTLLFCNRAYAEFFGASRTDLESVNFWSRIDDEVAPGLRAALARLTPDHPARPVMHPLRRADGVLRWIEWTNSLVDGDAPGGGEFQSIGRDVTAQREFAEALRKSEEKYRLLFETASVGLGSIGSDGRLINANPELCRILALSPREIAGRFWEDFVLGSDVERHRALFAMFRSGAASELSVEIRIAGRAGGERWVNVSARKAEDVNGGFLHSVLVVKDIDEQKRVEADLAQRSRTLSLALEAAYAIAFVWDVRSDEVIRLHSVEPALQQNVGAPDRLSDIVGAVHPDDRTAFRRNVDAALQAGAYRNEFRICRPDGSVRWLEEWGHVEFDSGGAPLRLVGISMDVTTRKEAEARLRESEERFRTMATTAQEGICLLDRDLTTLFANPSMTGLLGSPEDFVGTWSVVDYCLPDDVERVRSVLVAALNGEAQTFEFRIRRVDARTAHVLCAIAPVRDEGGGIVAAIGGFLDISERMAHEAHMTLVMRELSHRAKNLLAIILAIARQSSRVATDFQTFERSFSDRIGGLAQSHDLLVRDNWQGADLASLVRAQIGPFVGLMRERVSVRGPDIFLSPNAVQYVGMALHELATNASKHGALSIPAGRIAISWRVEGDVFDMEWSESGGPAVRNMAQDGFGRIVIEKMVARALEASASIDWRQEGIVWRLTAPRAQIEPRQALRQE